MQQYFAVKDHRIEQWEDSTCLPCQAEMAITIQVCALALLHSTIAHLTSSG